MRGGDTPGGSRALRQSAKCGRVDRMTRTQYYTATSIDAFIADERNSLDWLFEADRDGGGDSSDRFGGFFANVGAMALGSTTYEWVLEHERLLEQPEKCRNYYGSVPAWVFTSRDLPRIPDADVRFVSGDVRPVHEQMTAAAGDRNLWLVGGGELVGQFADQGLLDEIQVSLAPVTLGAGAPLLPRRLTGLHLESAEVAGGFAHLRYTLPRE